MARLGVTLPFDGLELHEHRDAVRQLVAAGYEDIWTGEVAGVDGLSQLALYAGWEESVGVSCAVVNAFTRTPSLLAMSAAALGEIAPGRSRFGIGAGSNVIVESWGGVPFKSPYTRTAEALAFVRSALSGERSTGPYRTFQSQNFKLARIPRTPPLLLLAALGPRMLELAATSADGVVLNFLSATDLGQVRQVTSQATRTGLAPLEISVRVFVVPGEDAAAETAARRHIAGYLTVPVYAQYHRWLGRAAALERMWEAWSAGDRKGAVQAIPAQVVQDLVIYGTEQQCAEGVRKYARSGADAVTVALMPPSGMAPKDQVEFLVNLANALEESK